jgi:hypothetical protein
MYRPTTVGSTVTVGTTMLHASMTVLHVDGNAAAGSRWVKRKRASGY